MSCETLRHNPTWPSEPGTLRDVTYVSYVSLPIVVVLWMLQGLGEQGWSLDWLQAQPPLLQGYWWVELAPGPTSRLVLNCFMCFGHGSLSLSAGCEPWPRNTGRQRSQQYTPTGANRLWGEFQNCVQQYWHYQGRLRWQKYLLLVSQFLGSVSTCFCLLGWCFKITKWVPFPYGPCAFQYGVFALILGSSEFTCEPLESRFLFLAVL